MVSVPSSAFSRSPTTPGAAVQRTQRRSPRVQPERQVTQIRPLRSTDRLPLDLTPVSPSSAPVKPLVYACECTTMPTILSVSAAGKSAPLSVVPNLTAAPNLISADASSLYFGMQSFAPLSASCPLIAAVMDVP